MNSFALLLTAALFSGRLVVGEPMLPAPKRPAPSHLARFDVGAYLAKDGTRLNVNIDKQLGGQIDIQFRNAKGEIFYERTLSATETRVRIVLNLGELTEGNYQLRVSNGLEAIVRTITVDTPEPTPVVRSITVG